MKTAYSYIRFSTPDQAKGDSLRRQTEKSAAWCARNDCYLDDSLKLRDLGISAFKGDNATKGALRGFLDAVTEGRVKPGSILLLESLDRLSRSDVDEAYDLLRGILRAGVEVVTFTPEEHFTRESLKDVAKILVAIIYLSRAHEESATKSVRLASSWSQKRSKMATVKMTAKSPCWLALNESRTAYDPVPEKVETVRRIFALLLDGVGADQIARRFNAQGVPPIGYATTWHKSYVLKTLKNRAVLGEYQPHTGHGARERKPIGDPIPDYYPAVVDEATFYRAQDLLAARRSRGGPVGDKVANLFTGLVFDARDHSTMTLVKKDRFPTMVSGAAARGEPGSTYLSFPYRAFESALLSWTREIGPEDLVAEASQAVRVKDQLEAMSAKHVALESRIKTIKERLASDPDFASLFDVLKRLEGDRVEVSKQVERLKAEQQVVENSPLQQTQSLLDMLGKIQGEELTDLRRKVKARFATLVAEVWVLVTQLDRPSLRQALVDVHFRAGGYRRLILIVNKGESQTWSHADPKSGDPDWYDLRHYRDRNLSRTS